MLAFSLIQASPNTDLSWILYILLGLLLFIVIIGTYASRKNIPPGSFSDQGLRKLNGKTIKAPARKNPRN